MKEMLTGGEEKSLEYARRILAGEDKEKVLEGLGPVFRDAVEKQIKSQSNFQEKSVENKISQPYEIQIPAQYEGLDSETLDFIWTIPEYVDPEKTNQEKQRKQKVLESIKKKEQEQSQKIEKVNSEQEDIELIRNKIKGLEKEPDSQNMFTEFRMKNGETDEGFYWNEYRNRKAKELKESGKFEWGKERIYFDVRIEDCEKLRDLVMKIAGENQIPIGFKYIDNVKTTPVNKDGKETRFVTNFASSDDARKLYSLLSQSSGYQSLIPDRKLDYKGVRIDDLAEYTSGYREIRGALERIMSAKLNSQDRYEYLSEYGLKRSISREQFNDFQKRYQDLNKLLDVEKQKWIIAENK
jgi:hypothetical protein